MSRSDISIVFEQLPAKAGAVKDQGAHRDFAISINGTKRADDYELPCGPPSCGHTTIRRRMFFPAAAGAAAGSGHRSGLLLDAVYGASFDESWQLDREQRDAWPRVIIEIRTQGGVTTTYTLRGLSVVSHHVDHDAAMEELVLTCREVEQKVQNGGTKTLKTNAAREAAAR